MSANPLAGVDPHCPRCFRLVLNDYVFCQYCGQFVHQNVPADSRPWDSRPPQLPAAAPEAPAAPSIELPEDALPYRSSEEPASDQAPVEATDASLSADDDGPSEKSDSEPA